MRIGVNAGSLDPDIAGRHGGATEALVASAQHGSLLRGVDFHDVKIS